MSCSDCCARASEPPETHWLQLQGANVGVSGQTLNVGNTYVAKSSDNAWSIYKRFGMSRSLFTLTSACPHVVRFEELNPHVAAVAGRRIISDATGSGRIFWRDKSLIESSFLTNRRSASFRIFARPDKQNFIHHVSTRYTMSTIQTAVLFAFPGWRSR